MQNQCLDDIGVSLVPTEHHSRSKNSPRHDNEEEECKSTVYPDLECLGGHECRDKKQQRKASKQQYRISSGRKPVFLNLRAPRPLAIKSQEHNDEDLPSVPEASPAKVILLQEVTGHGFVFSTRARLLQKPCRGGRRRSHASPPFSSGSPLQSFTRDCWVSRTTRIPLEVARKCRFALPPRSAVASPSDDETSPFSCSRVSAS